MKVLQSLIIFCLIVAGLMEKAFAQIPSGSFVYRVVNVKGSPLRKGKEILRDGQKIEEKEQVMFTSMKDAVVLLNQSFDKIYLKPKGPVHLKKLIKVGDFAQGKIHGNPSSRGSVMNLRGGMTVTEFQSISDTLRLHILNDLKRDPDVTEASFKFFDQYMESIKGVLKIDGEFLVISPKKSGFYSLYFSKGTSNSEVLAEIEFLDMDELKSELKFVATSASHVDSAKSNQIKYIRKLYPKVLDSQISEILAKK